MAVTKRLRYEILRRDNHACRYCGGKAPDAVLTIDHVTPKALGGTDTADNLVAACKDCNAGKSSATPDECHVDDVAGDAFRWAEAIRLATQRYLRRAEEAWDFMADFDDAWTIWGHEEPRHSPRRPSDYEASIEQIIAAGLDTSLILGAIDKAMANTKVPCPEKWRYFCGICWRTLEGLHADARRLIESGAV